LSHPLGKLGVTYTLHLLLVGKFVVDFLFAIIERSASSCIWNVISIYWPKSAFFTLTANFRWNGISPTNLCWCQKTRMITLSYLVKISAVYFLVSSHSTRVMGRGTDGRTDRQNYHLQDRASIAAWRGNNLVIEIVLFFNQTFKQMVNRPTTYHWRGTLVLPTIRSYLFIVCLRQHGP